MKKPIKTPIQFFMDLIPHQGHPDYGTMVLYPFTLFFAVVCIFYFQGLLFESEPEALSITMHTVKSTKII